MNNGGLTVANSSGTIVLTEGLIVTIKPKNLRDIDARCNERLLSVESDDKLEPVDSFNDTLDIYNPIRDSSGNKNETLTADIGIGKSTTSDLPYESFNSQSMDDSTSGIDSNKPLSSKALKAIELLDSWCEEDEGDEKEQLKSLKLLANLLNENRPPDRKLF